MFRFSVLLELLRTVGTSRAKSSRAIPTSVRPCSALAGDGPAVEARPAIQQEARAHATLPWLQHHPHHRRRRCRWREDLASASVRELKHPGQQVRWKQNDVRSDCPQQVARFTARCRRLRKLADFGVYLHGPLDSAILVPGLAQQVGGVPVSSGHSSAAWERTALRDESLQANPTAYTLPRRLLSPTLLTKECRRVHGLRDLKRIKLTPTKFRDLCASLCRRYDELVAAIAAVAMQLARYARAA
mmetsp:Transcript_58818/g.164239  ORF Transcript_58818/g.164239 Transcript_58818/m.164239 type:complete len:244 (+) Transcript_58818:262-993(+)